MIEKRKINKNILANMYFYQYIICFCLFSSVFICFHQFRIKKRTKIYPRRFAVPLPAKHRRRLWILNFVYYITFVHFCQVPVLPCTQSISIPDSTVKAAKIISSVDDLSLPVTNAPAAPPSAAAISTGAYPSSKISVDSFPLIE